MKGTRGQLVLRSIALLLIGTLMLLPLVLFLIERIFGFLTRGVGSEVFSAHEDFIFLFFSSSDAAVAQLAFVFSCVAGIYAARERKHLSVTLFSCDVDRPMHRVLSFLSAICTVAVLSACFFASGPNIVAVFRKEEAVWGVPLRWIFTALPCMYGALLFHYAREVKCRTCVIVGLLVGVLISTGSIASVLFHLFDLTVPLLDSVFHGWVAVGTRLFWPFVLLLLLLAAQGLPLFITLLAIAYLALSVDGGYVDTLPLEGYKILTDTGGIVAVPLFVTASLLLARGSTGTRLLRLVKEAVGWLRGGAAVACVAVAALFTSLTGVSGVTILALGSLFKLILTGNKYPEHDAEALITSSGAIGLLFPPSAAIIIFGATNILTVHIVDLFKGALLPGTLLVLSAMCLGVAKDRTQVRPSFSWQLLVHAVRGSVFDLALPVCISLGYFSGTLNLLQCASLTTLLAFVLGTWVRRDFTVKEACATALESLPIVGGILIIVAAAKGLSFYLVDANVPDTLIAFLQHAISSKYAFLLLLNVLLLGVGCIMDLYSAILVISPLVLPLAVHFGVHPVHASVVFLMNLELGALTPPIGMNLFIASFAFEKPIVHLTRAIAPFLLAQLGVLLLTTYIPWLSTEFL